MGSAGLILDMDSQNIEQHEHPHPHRGSLSSDGQYLVETFELKLPYIASEDKKTITIDVRKLIQFIEASKVT